PAPSPAPDTNSPAPPPHTPAGTAPKSFAARPPSVRPTAASPRRRVAASRFGIPRSIHGWGALVAAFHQTTSDTTSKKSTASTCNNSDPSYRPRGPSHTKTPAPATAPETAQYSSPSSPPDAHGS